MEHFDNILYISLLQILPSSIIFFIIWNIITNHFYKSVFATLGFSTWIIFNSICLRKTRYRANHLVICGNYINRDNHIHTESNIIINNELKISVIRLIIILLPTVLCNMFIYYVIFVLCNIL